MSMRALSNRRRFPSVEIDVALAYEFLMTLCAISFPQDPQDPQDLEASEETGGWYEATRAKASPDLLEAIEQFSSHYEEIWTHLLGLAYDCPPPRDVAAFIAHLKTVEASELLLHLVGYYLRPFRRATQPDVILQAIEGNEEAQKEFLRTSFPDDANWQGALRRLLTLDPETTKNYLLNIFQRWYDEIFHDQEAQLMSILVLDAKAKRMLKQMVSPKQLIEQATNGFDYVPEPYIREVVLIPSFILRPWVITSEHHDVKIFCYPVADESLMEDDEAPPVHLVRLCKAFADERRLRILKKLTVGDYSLQEVADDFGVVKSTMNHHFIILRTAGLVRLRTSDNQYSLRHDAIAEMCELLYAYLAKK
jgi:DNA-binding transcriptional ArsR family regulator